MKKGMYFTFRFKRLFTLGLIFSLTASFVCFLSFKDEKTADVSGNGEIEPVIIIDAGHGGEDGGTASSKGTLEKNLNLEISLKLNDIFKLLGYETIMTRDSDKMIYEGEHSTQRSKKISDVKNRLKITKDNPNGILLSIHQNYFSESKYSGAQVFYSPKNEKSKSLAEIIQQNIVKTIQPDNTRKTVKGKKDVYLLYYTEIPAVMVECGFMSNPGEALLLEDSEYQRKLAFVIADAVNDFFKT